MYKHTEKINLTVHEKFLLTILEYLVVQTPKVNGMFKSCVIRLQKNQQ